MITTRGFEPSDAEAFLTLYRECLDFYDVPPATAEMEATLIEHLSARRHMSCELAFVDGSPAGFATWALTFPARNGMALLMKELFVADRARETGVGRALMAALLHHADHHGCVRMDWQTDGTNTGSRAFYAKLGAPEFAKISYRIPGEDFARFAKDLT